MPALDPTLLSILGAGQPGAQSAFVPIAHALAQKHMEELAAEQAMVDRAKQHGDELSRQQAARSPYVQNLTQQASAPVSAFDPEQPGSYAPGAARDMGTLADAMPPNPGTPQSAFNGPSQPAAGLQLTGGWDPTPLPDQRQPGAYSDTAFAPSPPSRQEVARDLAPSRGVSRRPQSSASHGPQNADELAAGKDVLKDVVSRRQTEEQSRRALQTEDLRSKSKGRDAQLSAATKLLMNLRDNSTKMAVEKEKARAIMNKKAKTGQDLKALKDGWNLAREHADAAKSAVAMLYQAGAAGAAEGSPESTNYQEALSESRRALLDAHEWERAYTDATNDVKTSPKVGGDGSSGATQQMMLDSNGQLVPAKKAG